MVLESATGACLICNKANCACGGLTTMAPVDIPSQSRKRDAGPRGPVVRVDRGDGHLFRMPRSVAVKFVAANRGAFILGERRTSPTPAAVPDTDQPQEPRALADLTMVELINLADERGVQVPARPKAAIVEALEAAGVTLEPGE